MDELSRIYADFQNVDTAGRLRLNTVGTFRDLDFYQIKLKEGLKIRLCMEEVEATGTVTFSEDENIWAAEIDWNAVENNVDYIPSDDLPDDTIVVRGGKKDPMTISKSTATHPSGFRGISVVCAPGKTVEELAATVPHSMITCTTVGAIRRAGGAVVSTRGKSPYHATLLVIDELTSIPSTPTILSENSKIGLPRLFADFNNTETHGRVRLNTIGTTEDLEALQLELREDLQVELHDFGEFQVEAKVVSSSEGWAAEIHWPSKLSQRFTETP